MTRQFNLACERCSEPYDSVWCEPMGWKGDMMSGPPREQFMCPNCNTRYSVHWCCDDFKEATLEDPDDQDDICVISWIPYQDKFYVGGIGPGRVCPFCTISTCKIAELNRNSLKWVMERK